MLPQNTTDYLLNRKVKIFQPTDGYRASVDAVFLSAAVANVPNNARLLDVGSGTGAVSLCLAHRLQQQNVEIIGAEIQPELVELANYSAAQNNFGFLHYLHTDIRQKSTLPELRPCRFDVVISNPPYSEHDLPSPKTGKATAHNMTSFGLENWLAYCLKMAKPFGKICLINRAEALLQICHFFLGKAGNITVLPIFTKPDQAAKRVIVTAQKDSKAPCRILPPFTVHTPSGEYTDEAAAILRDAKCFAELRAEF